jgi:hypothetical protein
MERIICTPETDRFAEEEAAGLRDITELYTLARELEEKKNEAINVLSYLSHYLAQGLGEEETTANQYKERILEGINQLLADASTLS